MRTSIAELKSLITGIKQTTPKSSIYPEISNIEPLGIVPWPGSIVRSSLRDCPPEIMANRASFKFYGQYGGFESGVYNAFFSGKCYGTYIDIGANDGTTYSNSRFFDETLKWKGILVEPNPIWADTMKKNRPNAISLNVGAGEKSGTLQFVKVSGGPNMLSAFKGHEDMERIDREIKQVGGSKEIVDVPVMTVAEIMDKYGMKWIDFMSLDAEGYEGKIVAGFDFKRHVIKYIFSESDSIEKYLSQYGYRKIMADKSTGQWWGGDTIFERYILPEGFQ